MLFQAVMKVLSRSKFRTPDLTVIYGATLTDYSSVI
jgi:hypothetical protein